ncbi:UNVERIFIED_CONTAM: hypothetical protein GTU68_048324, partial [Idotea baltica]|nr:hypothetical protein [Idotea baltica]
GREHALAWKTAQSEKVTQVFVAPGNQGLGYEKKIILVDIQVHCLQSLLSFAKKNRIDLTIVGSELPLSLGIVDLFTRMGLACLGPTQYCAQLESSKFFSKQFMFQNKIPTAFYKQFTVFREAEKHLHNMIFPKVIKVNGLAGGKGVYIVYNSCEYLFIITKLLGARGLTKQCTDSIIIEDFLIGEEASFIVLCDGTNILPMASSKDHKTIFEFNKGYNTGGMGAYSPSHKVTNAVSMHVVEDVIKPVLEGMRKRGHIYKGFLYAGLMITPLNYIRVLEFNCRFGDPETQPILLRLKSNFVELCLSAIQETLCKYTINWSPYVALGIVMVAKGYPIKFRNGDKLNYFKSKPGIKVFYSGVSKNHGVLCVNGGRILCITVLGATLVEARQRAYSYVRSISWGSGYYYRKDIGLL